MSEASSLTPSQYIELAQQHWTAGRSEEAIATLVEATSRFPVSAEAHELLGLAYGQVGRNEEAVRSLNTSVSLRPDMNRARLNLAIAYRNLGRHTEAARELEELLRRDPSNQEALRLQALSGPAQTPIPNYVPQAQQAAYQQQAAFAPAQGYAQQPAYPPPGPAQAAYPMGAPTAPQPTYGSQQPYIPGVPQAQPTQPMVPGGYAPPPPPPGYGAPAPAGGYRGGVGPRYGAGAPYGAAAAPVSGDDPGALGGETFARVLMEPTGFFRDNRGWDDLMTPVKFTLVVGAIFFAIQLVFMIIRLVSQGAPAEAAGAMVAGGVVGLVIGIPLAVLFTLAGAGLLHLFVRLFGGDGPYSGTVRAVVYSSVPGYILQVVAGIITLVAPTALLFAGFLGIGVAIWTLVLVVIGLREIHAMSTVGAFFAAVLPGLAAALVLGLLLWPVFLGAYEQARNLNRPPAVRQQFPFPSPGSDPYLRSPGGMRGPGF